MTRGRKPRFAKPLHVGAPQVADRKRYFHLLEGMLDRNWLTNDGPLVREFEASLAARLQVRNVVCVVNGTVALEIAIRALDFTGEVIVPSYTFIASAHAVHWRGLKPVFADIDACTHNIAPASIEELITPATSGIIATHLWGVPADIAGLSALSSRHGLKLVFDAAHAFGAHHDKPIANFGDCEVFSFHATKCLNSLEGGAVTTNDDALAQRVRLIRNFGFAGYDDVVHAGTNGKMSEACAAMGVVNLEHIDEILAANRMRHDRYQSKLAGIPGFLLREPAANAHYVVAEISPAFGRTRDELLALLHAENILARRYFWPGCHRMRPYRDLWPEADALLPNTNAVANRTIVLPNGGGITLDDIDGVSEVIQASAA